MLIETSAELAVGEPLEVDIPEAGASQAVVVWGNGRLFGCEFQTPIPPAAVSAALLRSDFIADRDQVSAGTQHGSRADPLAARPLGAGEPLRSAVLWLVVALLAGALGYFLLTGDVWAPLVTAAIAGLIVAILVAMGVRVQNDADY